MTDEHPSAAITQLLLDATDQSLEARERMLPLVYDELRRIAAGYMKRERPDHTIQATALVHEAYLRLVDQQRVDWQNRAQFVGLAAVMMRRILVNHARDRAAAKRGGIQQRVSLSVALDLFAAPPSTCLRCTRRSIGCRRSTRGKCRSSS